MEMACMGVETCRCLISIWCLLWYRPERPTLKLRAPTKQLASGRANGVAEQCTNVWVDEVNHVQAQGHEDRDTGDSSNRVFLGPIAPNCQGGMCRK